MNRTLIICFAVSLALGSAPALAEQADAPPAAVWDDPDKPIDEIVVIAPRVVRERDVRGPGLARYTAVELNEIVDISDLDIGRSADLFAIETRVRDAAGRICRELEEMYPGGRPGITTCIRRATADAMDEVHEAVRALGGG